MVRRFALIAGCCLALACEAAFTTTGMVVTPSGAPVPSAQVTFGNSCFLTDSAGHFRALSIQGMLDRHVVLSVEQHGFRPYRHRYRGSADTLQRMQVVLVPDSTAPRPKRDSAAAAYRCAPPIPDRRSSQDSS